jgi:hypothetical protein
MVVIWARADCIAGVDMTGPVSRWPVTEAQRLHDSKPNKSERTVIEANGRQNMGYFDHWLATAPG